MAPPPAHSSCSNSFIGHLTIDIVWQSGTEAVQSHRPQAKQGPFALCLCLRFPKARYNVGACKRFSAWSPTGVRGCRSILLLPLGNKVLSPILTCEVQVGFKQLEALHRASNAWDWTPTGPLSTWPLVLLDLFHGCTLHGHWLCRATFSQHPCKVSVQNLGLGPFLPRMLQSGLFSSPFSYLFFFFFLFISLLLLLP